MLDSRQYLLPTLFVVVGLGAGLFSTDFGVSAYGSGSAFWRTGFGLVEVVRFEDSKVLRVLVLRPARRDESRDLVDLLLDFDLLVETCVILVSSVSAPPNSLQNESSLLSSFFYRMQKNLMIMVDIFAMPMAWKCHLRYFVANLGLAFGLRWILFFNGWFWFNWFFGLWCLFFCSVVRVWSWNIATYDADINWRWLF